MSDRASPTRSFKEIMYYTSITEHAQNCPTLSLWKLECLSTNFPLLLFEDCPRVHKILPFWAVKGSPIKKCGCLRWECSSACRNSTIALGELRAIEVKRLCGRVSTRSTRVLRECLARVFHNSGKEIHSPEVSDPDQLYRCRIYQATC